MGYTDATKAEAVALYLEHGLAEAQRRTRTDERPDGIPKQTMQSWLKNAGHDPAEIAGRTNEKTKAATEARIARMGQDKAALAADLLADLQRLRAQLFAPCTEKRIVTLSGGKDSSATWVVAEAERDQPTFSEQVSILTSIGIAVDKVQILTGDATSIVRTPWDGNAKPVVSEAGPRADGLRSVPTGEAV